MNTDHNYISGNWLNKLNGKIIERIFQIDFNSERDTDIYLPWVFFITFLDTDKFLEIEGDFDGDHIKVSLNNISELEQKLESNNQPNEPNLWKVYETRRDETLGKLLGQQIGFIEFGIDKLDIKNGLQGLFNFIRFNCDSISVTIYEGSVTGLDVSDDPNVRLNFEESFEKHSTR